MWRQSPFVRLSGTVSVITPSYDFHEIWCRTSLREGLGYACVSRKIGVMTIMLKGVN
jgi:hypothetical protein